MKLYSTRIAALYCIIVCSTATAQDVRFIPSTPDNTTLEGGVALEIVAADPEHPHQLTRGPQPPTDKHRWHWWNTKEFACFATHGEEGSDAPVLRTLVSGLRPNANYQVDGFFRAEGGKQPPHPTRGDIRMGFTIARTEAFGPLSGQGLSCIIGVDHPSGRVTRMESHPTDDPDFPLFRVSLGIARSDADGTIVVFIDDQPNDTLSAATLYQGVAVAPADDNARPIAGTGSAQDLVEAVRVDDRETIDRELAAGADLNTPDREGRTALFYACLAGDHDLAKRFLNAGANPNAPGQQLPPLWAAARNGEAELVGILLDAGAEVTTACLGGRQLGRFMDRKGHVWINPVTAALLSGSVETLTTLLNNQPDIDLAKATFGLGYEFTEPVVSSPRTPQRDLIRLSMSYQNYDMVHWLIVRGHSLSLSESPSLPFNRRESNQHGARSIMIRAIMRQSPRMDIVDALAARGVPLIVPDDALFSPVIAPWDALSAAAFEGHAGLVRRWLPLANAAANNYRLRLITLADAGGCPECARLVREAFPDVPRPGYRWSKEQIISERQRFAGDTSAFIPRTTAPVARPENDDTIRLVFIGTGTAAGPADALAALASTNPAIVVIDREELTAALAERSLAAEGSLSPSQLNELGDFLKADMVVTATPFGEKADSVLRFEAHDVRTGLTRHRVFQRANDFMPDAFASGFLADLRAKMEASQSANGITAITLLGITAEAGHFHGSALTPLLHAGLLQEIDNTQGLVALTRDQLAPLVAERALGHEGGLWGAAWTIEGGLRAGGKPGSLTLALRLRSVADDAKAHDITLEGPATAPRDLVMRAWAELRQHIDVSPSAIAEDNDRAERESARLAHEAEWLLNTPLAWQAAPLADAALYLGGDRLERLLLRQKCHWAGCHIINPLHQWPGRAPWSATGHPLAYHIHLYYLYWLEEHLELLRLTSASLDAVLTLFRDEPRHPQLPVMRELWQDVMRLTVFRCRLVPKSMNPAEKAMLDQFDRELQQLWLTIVPVLPDNLTTYTLDGIFQSAAHMVIAQRITMNFRDLPWLGDLLAREVLIRVAKPDISSHGWATQMAIGTRSTEEWIYPQSAALATTLENNLDENAPLLTLRQAEITWLRSHGPSRIAAAKSVAAAWIEIHASRLQPPNRILHSGEFAKWQASHGFGLQNSESSPFAMPLPSLVAAPRHCVDMEYRAGIYHRARRNLALASTRTGEWRNAAQLIARMFENEIPKLVERQIPASGYDLLMAAAREIDELFGTTVTPLIEPAVRDALPEESPPQSFGNTGGFRVAMRGDALPGELLADLATGLPGKHSFIISHAVDPRDRNLLWLISQPMPDDTLVLHESDPKSSQWERFTIHQPWLLCVDCRDGTIVRRVNLIRAAFGDDAPAQSPMRLLGGSLEGHIVFNDEAMLVLVRWRFDGRERQRVLVLDHKDGTVLHRLPYQLVLTSDLTNRIRPNIVGLGRDFYLLVRDQTDQDHYQIWKLSPNRELARLNTPGRRPPESPFDAEDRNPKLLRINAGKIMVASSWGFSAEYDPGSGLWNEQRDMDRNELQRHVGKLDRIAHQATLDPKHTLPMSEGCGGRFAPPPDDTEPGTLIYLKNAGRSIRLPLNFPVDSKYPGTFRISPMPVLRVADLVGHYRQHPPESVGIFDLVRSDMVRPAILNQTNGHLIVGLYLEIQAAAGIRSSSYEHLPYLWKIPKSTVRERLQQELDEKLSE